MTVTESAAGVDLAQVKRRQQQMWASGDFHAVATLIQPVADTLVNTADLQAGWRVLDVACGSGNAAIAAARLGCDVVGIDYVPALLARGRKRAEAEGVKVDLIEGDAEAIPFADGSFDAVVRSSARCSRRTTHRPRPSSPACAAPAAGSRSRPGRPTASSARCSRWSPATCRRPRASRLPLLWGTKQYVSDLLGDEISSIACNERTFTYRFRSAEAFVEYFRTYYGPTVKAFEAVGDLGRRRALRRPRPPRAPLRRHGHRPGRDPRDVARDRGDPQPLRGRRLTRGAANNAAATRALTTRLRKDFR